MSTAAGTSGGGTELPITPQKPKRALQVDFGLALWPEFHEETPRERKKGEHGAGEEKTKTTFWAVQRRGRRGSSIGGSCGGDRETNTQREIHTHVEPTPTQTETNTTKETNKHDTKQTGEDMRHIGHFRLRPVSTSANSDCGQQGTCAKHSLPNAFWNGTTISTAVSCCWATLLATNLRTM